MPSVARSHQDDKKPLIDLSPATWVMYFRRVKVVLSKSGLWLGPARVIMTAPVPQWSGSVHEPTGQVGVVRVSHGSELIRSHLTQRGRCSERVVYL